MKARAGGLPPRAAAADRVRRAGRGRPEPLRRDRGVSADGRRRGRHPGRGPGAGSRAGRGRTRLARRPRRGRRDARRSSELASVAAGTAATRNLMVRHDRRRAGGRDHRRVGRARCARCSAATAPPPGSARPAPASSDGELTELRGGGRAPAGAARAPAEDPGRKARPGRTLQRRRADRACAPATRAWTWSTKGSA